MEGAQRRGCKARIYGTVITPGRAAGPKRTGRCCATAAGLLLGIVAGQQRPGLLLCNYSPSAQCAAVAAGLGRPPPRAPPGERGQDRASHSAPPLAAVTGGCSRRAHRRGA
jgi:hypothetical protein